MIHSLKTLATCSLAMGLTEQVIATSTTLVVRSTVSIEMILIWLNAWPCANHQLAATVFLSQTQQVLFPAVATFWENYTWLCLTSGILLRGRDMMWRRSKLSPVGSVGRAKKLAKTWFRTFRIQIATRRTILACSLKTSKSSVMLWSPTPSLESFSSILILTEIL